MYDDITRSIENLARAAEHEDDTVRIWAVATLASRLGMVAVLTTLEDPVEAITEVGEMWVGMVAQQLEEQPGKAGDTLRASHGVVQRLLRDVGELPVPT